MPTYTKVNGQRFVNGMPSMNTPLGVRMRTIGTQEVIAALNKKALAIGFGSLQGLLRAAAFLREDMDKTEPKIPVSGRSASDPSRRGTGALRTRYKTVIKPTKTIMSKGGTPEHQVFTVEAGWLSAPDEYAAYVHEMTQPPYEHPIDWSRPGSGPKFFEAAIKRNTGELVRIINDTTKTQAGI